MDSMSRVESRGSSSDFLMAQMRRTLLGRHGFPSLTRWRTSLKMAKNGETPIPPATRMRFSYLPEKIGTRFDQLKLRENEPELPLLSTYKPKEGNLTV